MRVLIACEYSGITREAFAARGHDAWSCDLLPSEIPGRHFQTDVLKVLDMGWDLLIAHPPCTYLSYAGMRFWQDPERTRKRIAAADFFMRLYQANIPRVCVENPRGIMSKLFRPPDQEIHPWYFGEPQMKRTGLWLRGLPPLRYQLQPDLFSPTAPVQAAPPPVLLFNSKTQKKNENCKAHIWTWGDI